MKKSFALTAIKDVLKESLQEVLSEALIPLCTIITDTLNDISDLRVEVETVKSDNAALKAEINTLRDEMKAVKSTMQRVEEKANANEQYSRKSNIRISGIPEDEVEDGRVCIEKGKSFIQCNLDVNVEDNEIDKAHRVGKRRTSSPRSMIVKFISHSVKERVYTQKKKLRGKSGLFINEDLTKKKLGSTQSH